MVETDTAPIDHLGVPLPIIPSENLLQLTSGSEDYTKHHEFYLQGKEKFRGIGQKALRASRIIKAEAEVHNKGPRAYHRFFKSSPGVSDEQRQFNIALLSHAGYIPEQGVDLWSGTPDIRPLEKGEREILTTLKPEGEQYREYGYKYLNYNYDPLRKLFKKFVKKQDITSADPIHIGDFIATPRISLTRDSGHEILQHAVSQAVAPIRDDYQNFYEAGLLHPFAASDAETALLNGLGTEQYRERLFPTLRKRLLTELDLGSFALQTEVSTVELAA